VVVVVVIVVVLAVVVIAAAVVEVKILVRAFTCPTYLFSVMSYFMFQCLAPQDMTICEVHN